MVTLAAKGLAGREFVARRRAGCDPGLPDRPDEPYRFGLLGAVRQWIEAVFDTLQESAWAGRHGVRWQVNAQIKCALVAYDH